MKVVVATHPAMLEHDTGSWHPERPDRIGAVLTGIHASGLEIVTVEAPPASRDVLHLLHDPLYVDWVEELCQVGGGVIGYDTVASRPTWDAALRSVGAVFAAVEEVRAGGDVTGFAVTRPPGHHALAGEAMGFCFFNNVALAAAEIRNRGERVAVLDWDVHHGNGTQALLGDDPGVLYVSIHQDSFYPYEGEVDDIDRFAPGTTVNIPLPVGSGGDLARAAWGELVIPVVSGFEPDWTLVSAGYDGHRNDPLAGLRLVDSDYGWMAARLGEVVPANRVVFALEGGYDLPALESSTAATLRGLAGEESGDEPLDSSEGAWVAVDHARAGIARHWKI